MEFRCRLGTPGGEIIEGVYVADSEDRLRREFEEKGLYVLAIQRAGRLALGSLALPTRSRIATREFLVFNQELATLLKAGMPLVQSLDILRRRVSNPVFKSVLNDVYDRVRAGSSLSESFEAHGAMFPGVYTASLMAGEKSGNLEQVIRRYVAYVKVVEGVRRKVISALIYPAVLLSLSVIVVGILVLRVVPQFSGYYEQFGQELPFSTRVIVAVSSYATAYFGGFVVLVAAGTVAIWAWLKRPGERERVDRWILRLPLLGSVARKFATSQASRTLATLLGGGIPLVNAIDVSGPLDQESLHGAGTAQGVAAGARGPGAGGGDDRQRRVSGRGAEDGGSGGADRRAAGDAEQPVGLLRRGNRNEPGPLRDPGGTDSSDHHGHRDRRAVAGALHAALQPVERAAVTGKRVRGVSESV